jgi:hypothetical protein
MFSVIYEYMTVGKPIRQNMPLLSSPSHMFLQRRAVNDIPVPITTLFKTVFLSKLFLVAFPVLSVLISMAEETQKIQITQKEKPYHNHHREHVRHQTEKPQDSKDVGLDDEETEHDRASRPSRSGGRGKPPRRDIEESINDPYCE